MQINYNAKPRKILSQLDYDIMQLQRELDWILFKEKQSKIQNQLMLKRAYQLQKQQKPRKN